METTIAFHAAANIFPLEDETLNELAEDIKQQGLQCPIEMLDDKIIDGRRRFMACRIAGVEPDFVTVHPADPIAYVMSLNYHRRNLSPSQKAIVAGRAREHYDNAAKQRQKESGKHHGRGQEKVPVNLPEPISDARDAVGKALGISGKTVDYGTKVLRTGTPELIAAVEADKIAVSTAAKIAAKPADEQRNILKSIKGKPTCRRIDELNEPEIEEGKSRGIGVQRAHEAIACLKKIPVKDALRKRGLQIVSDWINHNK